MITLMSAAVKPLDNSDAAVAAKIYVVQMAAYEQEARLIGAQHFPPLHVTADDVRLSNDLFFGIHCKQDIVGVIAVCENPSMRSLTVNSLVVHPSYQRRGVGRLLLSFVTSQFEALHITVSTAVKNTPALALYAKLGFVEVQRCFVGSERLELVALEKVCSIELHKRANQRLTAN